MYSIEEVCDKFGWSEKTIMRYIYDKKPISKYIKKIGKKHVMLEEDYYRFLEDLPYMGD